jgi:hypothetical protein
MVEIGLIKIGQGAPKLETMEDYNKTSGTYFGYDGGGNLHRTFNTVEKSG